MHAMAKMVKLAKNRQLLAIRIGCQKWPLGGWRFWRKWRNWRKIASCWQLELDAKSGPLEAGDFGENGDFGEIGDFGKIAMHAMAKLAKNHQPLAI